MISRILCVALLLSLLAGNSCTVSENEISDQGTSTLSGQIANLADTTLSFTFEEYEFLSEQRKQRVKLDSLGNFNMQIEHNHPLKGFFSYGRIPKSYTFDIVTVEGKDTSLMVGSADFRIVYIYLEPGDSIYYKVDANNIEHTLQFSGSQPNNNEFVNEDEYRFNDYKSKYLRNYYNKTYRQPDDYKRVTKELQNSRTSFINDYNTKSPISETLKSIYLNTCYSEAISAMVHYPAGHAGFNDGVFPELPDGYYDFIDDVVIEGSIADNGIMHYFFLNSWLRQKYRIANPNDSELYGFYEFVKAELKGEMAYEFLAYALGRDFTKSLYEEFGDACPYPEMATKVKEKYKHLEGMLAGSPAPEFTLENQDGELFSLKDFEGKHVYIDFWATWCKPCVKEFPDLRRIQDEFRDKNIVFISISIDKLEDKGKWKAYVADEKLGGVQLHADKETKDRLSKALNIKSIPRFVLIDPEGKIVTANAPRPSNPKLIEELEALSS